MTMKTRIAATVAAAAIVLSAGFAAAQNYSLNPRYGTLNLSAGFQPDPQVVNVEAGGSRSARNLNSACAGYIDERPDVRLNYQSGQFQLMISADASADTTLVINGPDGTWYCDDDGGNNGMNPLLRFNNPPSGQYDIWIGTYSSGATQRAQLYVSEVGSR